MSTTTKKRSASEHRKAAPKRRKKAAETSTVDWTAKFNKAVEREGDDKTFSVIDAYYDSRTPLREAFEKAQHHAAFQIIKRSEQIAVHNGDEDALEEFMHRLINGLCYKHSLKRLGTNSSHEKRERAVKALRGLIG